jgi:hypothetical protein
MRLCAWASLNAPAIRDLLDHDNTVFVVPHGSPRYDGSGKLTGVDYAKLDALLELLRGHDVVLLPNGIPAISGEPGSPTYEDALKEYLDDLERRLAACGVDKEHFALYPVDEPGGNGQHAVDQVVAFGKAVKAVRPEIMLYVDGGGEVPQFEAMAPVVDVWCPALGMLAENSPVMRLLRADAKHLWSYDCGYGYTRPAGPNIKNVNLVGQFRTAALFALRNGGTGIGYWSYNIGDDPWGRSQFEYPLVYPGANGPVPSRRWEAVREGVEDARILAALRARAKEKGVPAAARRRIHQLLDDALPKLIDAPNREVITGLARYVLDLSNNDATIRTFRDQMLDCIEALSPSAATAR